jgi:DNA repair exonuclease SbcCD ATPase subunit
MRKLTAPLLLLLLCIVQTFHADSQTAGAGTLSTIESKANSIQNNDTKVADLNRQHLESYSLESEKSKRLKREISSLIQEKEDVIDEYRRGQFCTGCSTPRSQFKPGESFPHPGQRVRAATAEEIAAVSKRYDDKIAAKREESRQFDGGENEFTRKRADLDKQMNALKNQSDKIREEIVALSKRYKELVVNDAKSIQGNYIAELMRIVAEKHYIEDRLNIVIVKLGDLNKEETQKISEARDKVAKQTTEDKNRLNGKIEVNKNRLQQLKTDHANRIRLLEDQVATVRNEIATLKNQPIRTANSPNSDEEQRKERIAALETRLAELLSTIRSTENEFNTREQQIESENKQLSDEIWQLTVNLSKKQQEAEDATKKAFSVKRRILEDAKAARTGSLEQTGSLLISKKAAARKKFMEYVNYADKERVRLINACQKAGCSCYGIDTQGTIVGNWNKAESCVGEMEAAHHSNDAVYGCTEESAVYKSHYSNLLGGLSDSDREALQRQSGKQRYDLIFRKITP